MRSDSMYPDNQLVPVWVDEKEVARILGVAVQTLRNRRFQGLEPCFYKVGRSVRYKLSDVLSFMERHKVEPLRCGMDATVDEAGHGPAECEVPGQRMKKRGEE